MNYNEHNENNHFLKNFLTFNSVLSLIVQPDLIVIDPDIILDNLTVTSSEYLPQFAATPNMFANISGNKYNINQRYCLKFG